MAQRNRTYTSWRCMRGRCNDPKRPGYENYGGRGISVCHEWASFESFHRDMGDRPEGTQIDRIDNNLGYNKDNCQWSTYSENVRNSRSAKLSADDVSTIKTMLLYGSKQKDIADKFSTSPSMISRINKGVHWDDVGALPV